MVDLRYSAIYLTAALLGLTLNSAILVPNLIHLRELPPSSFMIYFLCLSDSILTVLAIGNSVTSIAHNSYGIDTLRCQIEGGLGVTFGLLSISICMGLTLFRYMVVIQQKTVTKTFSYTYLLTFFCISAFAGFLPFMMGSQSDTYVDSSSHVNCVLAYWHNRDPKVLISGTIAGVIGFASCNFIAFAYLKIYLEVAKSTEAKKVWRYNQQDAKTISVKAKHSDTSSGSPGVSPTTALPDDAMQRYLLIQSIAVVAAFLIGWAPYLLTALAEGIMGTRVGADAEFAVDLLVSVNEIANPVIVMVFDRDLRRHVYFPCKR